ncbi:MAG: NAD(P)-binding domain-containing protein [Flavobacteriales bacterium]|nr:NAD(P)-binding domain-containing protein [Flavobacteriales bacterium]
MEEQKGTLKVGVVGMGPVGQILAVHLKEAGCHVTICDRNKERVDLIRKDGLRLEGKMARHVRPDQAFHTASELAAEKPDVIILAIKVYHTRAVIEELLGARRWKALHHLRTERHRCGRTRGRRVRGTVHLSHGAQFRR